MLNTFARARVENVQVIDTLTAPKRLSVVELAYDSGRTKQCFPTQVSFCAFTNVHAQTYMFTVIATVKLVRQQICPYA